jgi:hypothetical protein
LGLEDLYFTKDYLFFKEIYLTLKIVFFVFLSELSLAIAKNLVASVHLQRMAGSKKKII